MNGESTVLIVGEDTGMSSMLSTLGLRPVVVGRPHELLAKRQGPAPSFVLFNLLQGTIEPRFLHAYPKERTPSLILADPKAPSGKVSLKNRRSTCAPARCTMATFRVPPLPS